MLLMGAVCAWYDAHLNALECYECSMCFTKRFCAAALKVGISALYMVKLEAES